MIETTRMSRDALMTEVEALRARLTVAERLLRGAGSLIDEALTTHIYDEQNGDEIPEDCGYTRCSREIDAFLEGRADD